MKMTLALRLVGVYSLSFASVVLRRAITRGITFQQPLTNGVLHAFHQSFIVTALKMCPESAFAFLGLDPSCSPSQCREAYLAFAHKLHPDRAAGATSNSVESTSAFQQLQEAYQVTYNSALESEQNRGDEAKQHLEESEETVLRHKAPKHRRYLDLESHRSFNSAGVGLSSGERWRLAQSERVAESVRAAADYRVSRTLEHDVPDDPTAKELTLPKSTANASKRQKQAFKKEVESINRLIDRYNLIVPTLKLQRCHIKPQPAIDRLLHTGGVQCATPPASKKVASESSNKKEQKVQPEENTEEDTSQSPWDPRYLAAVIRDFYVELARAIVSSMRGFKNHK